jgi:hypothetical protein
MIGHTIFRATCLVDNTLVNSVDLLGVPRTWAIMRNAMLKQLLRFPFRECRWTDSNERRPFLTEMSLWSIAAMFQAMLAWIIPIRKELQVNHSQALSR